MSFYKYWDETPAMKDRDIRDKVLKTVKKLGLKK